LEESVTSPQESCDHREHLSGRLVLPGFPTLERARIDAQPLGHLPPRQAEHPAGSGKAFREGDGERQGVVSRELENGRDAADGWHGCVAFPVANRSFVNANLVRNLLLEEFEVQTARANVVA
jgi:hypothetical protein